MDEMADRWWARGGFSGPVHPIRAGGRPDPM